MLIYDTGGWTLEGNNTLGICHKKYAGLRGYYMYVSV